MNITHSHRLILPADANHHGTLYAGSLLRIALETGYATACRHLGPSANLVLRRVLNVECLKPVPVGTVVELQGTVLHQTRAYLITGILGSPFVARDGVWLEALLGFVQVDEHGRPAELPTENEPEAIDESHPLAPAWQKLRARMTKLVRMR